MSAGSGRSSICLRVFLLYVWIELVSKLMSATRSRSISFSRSPVDNASSTRTYQAKDSCRAALSRASI
jgi:hypothetical protein